MSSPPMDAILYPQSSSQNLLDHLDHLKFFLLTAPSSNPSPELTPLIRFQLPNSSEYISCVYWGGLYHITGTDIVRALVFRFEAFGRPIRNMKKFEEGVFSDLRNLKPGSDACLEEPKSPFLELLFKHQCIRTQKKQKVFYWFSVPHDRLFLDALERDLKREKLGQESTTEITGEPARSFAYDPKRSLFEQFSMQTGGQSEEGELERVVREVDEREKNGMVSLFEGSPAYKQRKKKRVAGDAGIVKSKIQRSSVVLSPSPQYSPSYLAPHDIHASGTPEAVHVQHQCPLLTCGILLPNAEELEFHLQTHTISRHVASSNHGISHPQPVVAKEEAWAQGYEHEGSFPPQEMEQDFRHQQYHRSQQLQQQQQQQQQHEDPAYYSESSTPEHPWSRPHPHYYPNQAPPLTYSSPAYSTPLMSYSPSPNLEDSPAAVVSSYQEYSPPVHHPSQEVPVKVEEEYYTASNYPSYPHRKQSYEEEPEYYQSSAPPQYQYHYSSHYQQQSQTQHPSNIQVQLPPNTQSPHFEYTPFQFDLQSDGVPTPLQATPTSALHLPSYSQQATLPLYPESQHSHQHSHSHLHLHLPHDTYVETQPLPLPQQPRHLQL